MLTQLARATTTVGSRMRKTKMKADEKVSRKRIEYLHQHTSTHIVKPARMWCLCGVWQDTLLPSCQYACAVHCKSKSADKNCILAYYLINEYFTFGCVPTSFTKKSTIGNEVCTT